MKLSRTCPIPSILPKAVMLAVGLLSIQTYANPFDDSTENTVTNDTDYGSVLYVGSENPNNTLTVTHDATVQALEVIIGQFQDSTNNLLSIAGDSLLMAGNSDTNGLARGLTGNTFISASGPMTAER